MEDELGFKLFTRNKKAVELTEAGRDFYKRARSVIEHYERSVRCSASVAQGMLGTINISLPSRLEGFIFVDKLSLFRKKYPLVDLNVLVKSHNVLVTTVKSGKADIAFGSPEDMELSPEFTVIKLREDPMVLLCGVGHPLAKQEKITSEMLMDQSLVMSGPNGMPQTYKSLQTVGFTPGFGKNAILHVSNIDEFLLMIELGRGVGFLPNFVRTRVTPETSGIVCIDCEFDGSTPMMVTAAGFLKENQNPVLANFIDILLDTDADSHK
jgi:DNA-binding transcriptional LysR family regulator